MKLFGFALGVPAAVALLARVLTGPHAIDDAYITFRYARNFGEGIGLVYNPGEWVLGTTAPLWAVLLGAGYRLGFTHLPWLATVVSAVCDAGTVVLLIRFSLRLGWPPLGAALVGLAWALNPMSIAFATGGMETSLFILMALAALGLAASCTPPSQAASCQRMPQASWMSGLLGACGRQLRIAAGAGPVPSRGTRGEAALAGGALLPAVPSPEAVPMATTWGTLPLAACVAGLATLVRPEGGLLVVVVVAWAVCARRREAWLAAACGGAPMVAAGLTLWWRYGSPLPNSVAAKQVAYVAAWPFENALTLLLQAGLPAWSTYLLGAVPDGPGLLVAGLGLLALVELIRRSVPRLSRERIPWQPFAGFGILYLVFYVVVGLRGIRLFPWYLVPIAPFYLLGAAAGLSRLGGQRGAWLAVVLVLWQLPAIDWRQPLLPAGDGLGRERVLLDEGDRLAATLPPAAVIAAPEIGALGYASNLRMLDTVGLVSPAALAYYPLAPDQLVADNAIPPRLILDQQPDVVVALDAFAQRSLLPDPAFQRAYHLERAVPAQVWQSQQLLVFRRVDAVAVAP